MWWSQDSTPGSLAAEAGLFLAKLHCLLFFCVMKHKDLKTLGLNLLALGFLQNSAYKHHKPLRLMLNFYFH